MSGPYLSPFSFDGIPYTVGLCSPKFVSWCRVHRKKRIAKKWRKRFGAKMVCPGVVLLQTLKGNFIICPCALRAIKKLSQASASCRGI